MLLLLAFRIVTYRIWVLFLLFISPGELEASRKSRTLDKTVSSPRLKKWTENHNIIFWDIVDLIMKRLEQML